MTQRLESIILRSTPLKEVSLVCSAYTKELGLISFVTPRGSKHMRALVSPYSRLELIVTPPRSGELFRLKDASPLNLMFELRESLEQLRAAAACTKAVLQSQFPGKASPALFEMLRLHFEKIGEGQMCSANLANQFIVKLLKHEGLLETPRECGECKIDLKRAFVSRNGVYCTHHQRSGSVEMKPPAYEALIKLFDVRSWNETALPKEFSEKLQEIFTQKLER